MGSSKWMFEDYPEGTYLKASWKYQMAELRFMTVLAYRPLTCLLRAISTHRRN